MTQFGASGSLSSASASSVASGFCATSLVTAPVSLETAGCAFRGSASDVTEHEPSHLSKTSLPAISSSERQVDETDSQFNSCQDVQRRRHASLVMLTVSRRWRRRNTCPLFCRTLDRTPSLASQKKRPCSEEWRRLEEIVDSTSPERQVIFEAEAKTEPAQTDCQPQTVTVRQESS
ncbi:unnamed protein product, partial [Protopolystoma xenopodis]